MVQPFNFAKHMNLPPLSYSALFLKPALTKQFFIIRVVTSHCQARVISEIEILQLLRLLMKLNTDFIVEILTNRQPNRQTKK